MSDMNLSISGTKRLLTKGKYCDKNIVITASGTEAFMDAYQERLETYGYGYAFAGGGWADALFCPAREILLTRPAGYIFAYAKITSTKVPIIAQAGGNNCLFYCAYVLKTIPSLKVTEENTSLANWFYECTALEEVNFAEDSVIVANISFAQSSKLTNASVQTVINALKDLTGETTQTLTLHADVGAALTEEQKATITAKNWQLVY